MKREAIVCFLHNRECGLNNLQPIVQLNPVITWSEVAYEFTEFLKLAGPDFICSCAFVVNFCLIVPGTTFSKMFVHYFKSDRFV